MFDFDWWIMSGFRIGPVSWRRESLGLEPYLSIVSMAQLSGFEWSWNLMNGPVIPVLVLHRVNVSERAMVILGNNCIGGDDDAVELTLERERG